MRNRFRRFNPEPEPMSYDTTPYTAPAGTGIGHVHLKVADLDRAVRFYEEVLGFSLQVRLGDEAAFLGARRLDGEVYHHHIGLNTWRSRGGVAPPPGTTGLFHAAILYPDRPALARAVQRVLERNVALTGASDHGVSEAVYLDDPDGNGLELYRDRAPAEWPRHADGSLAMFTRRLDVDALVRDAGERAETKTVS